MIRPGHTRIHPGGSRVFFPVGGGENGCLVNKGLPSRMEDIAHILLR